MAEGAHVERGHVRPDATSLARSLGDIISIWRAISRRPRYERGEVGTPAEDLLEPGEIRGDIWRYWEIQGDIWRYRQIFSNLESKAVARGKHGHGKLLSRMGDEDKAGARVRVRAGMGLGVG